MATELEQNVRGCGEILLRDGAAWSLPYSCRTSARLTTQLLSHNYRAIMERVLPELGIDVKTRRRKANLIYSDDGHALDADESMAINKGLAMELLVASMLTCLDAPTSVTSWCVQGTNGEPKLFAQGDTEDVLATYGDFRVVAEVSAKRQTSLEFLQGQLGQGIKHGVMRNEKDGVLPTYVPLVNGGPWNRTKGTATSTTMRGVRRASRGICASSRSGGPTSPNWSPSSASRNTRRGSRSPVPRSSPRWTACTTGSPATMATSR